MARWGEAVSHTLSLPGGHTVEIVGISHGGPPDLPSGAMRTNSSTVWLRLDGGAWRPCNEKSAHKIRRWWELVATEADIADALAITVDE